jgi:hypothetical protein
MRSSVSSVPATSANLAAALTIAACALYVLKYLRGGTLGFIAACYAVWLLARAYNIWFGLRKNQPWFLSARERGHLQAFCALSLSPAVGILFFHDTTLAQACGVRLDTDGAVAGSIRRSNCTRSTVLVSGTISSMYPDLYFEDAANTGKWICAGRIKLGPTG